jgi:hypothetical protein
MKSAKCLLLWFLAVSLFCSVMNAQQSTSSPSSSVPRLVKFSGKAADAQNKAISGIAGATFAIYKEESGGSPLWLETQNIQADTKGNYTVQLGATKPDGLPLDLFSSGEARWLGVAVNGGQEQPRVLLVSVPYALKALDAETLGGRPASAFVAAPSSGSQPSQASQASEQANEIICSSGTACKTGFVPLFSSNGGSSKVSDSIIKQSGTTVSIAGAEAVMGNIASNGNLSAINVNASADVNAAAIFTGNVNAVNSSGAGTVAVFGEDDKGYGVYGTSSGGTAGVYGILGSGDPVFSYGVYGENDSVTGGRGVFGFSQQGAGGIGVQGYAPGSNAAGVAGSSNTFGSLAHSLLGNVPLGVLGESASGYGVAATSDTSNALLAENNSSADTLIAVNNGGGAPLYAQGTGGNFMFMDKNGNLFLTGQVFASAKDFKIDHPLDPANKYLYHASIESSEMKNIYDGIATLDGSGLATVALPDWFEAVNGDFRYQLTAVGAPGPNLHIAQEISNNQFTIAGGQPGMKVSWLVTGVRHDAYAKAHPLQASVDKPADERGFYLHPELYGAAAENSLAAAHHAQFMLHANAK